MKRVLIVDDSLTVRMDLEEVFRAAEWRTTLCASVAAAREALKGERFECIILDVLLPDGNGLELLREVKAAQAMAGVPVILLSTKAEVADHIAGMTVGADEYVGKPYDRGYLVSRAEQLTGQTSGRESSGRPTTVLVVEDSETFAKSLREALAQAGYQTVLARSGEEGLQRAAQVRPDAVIVDGLLPGIDGPTVLQRLKTDSALRRIPCLLLTGSLDAQQDELRSLEAGADAYVRKDEGLALVLARLRAMLRPGERRGEAGLEAGASVYGPKTVLAVDDSPTYLNALAEQLRQDGYNVVLARSGAEALDLLQVRPVDCVLLDLVMPGLSGQDVCQRIKASPAWRFLPVIMLTGMEAEEAMLDGFNAGADDFVPKSGDFAILRARLRAQLRRRQFEEETRGVLDELRRKDFLVAQARLVRESEQRMQMALQVSRSFAFEWEPATDRLVRSDSCGPLLGFGATECREDSGAHYRERIHPEDRERVRQAVAALKPGADSYELEYRVNRGDGTGVVVLEEWARGFFDAEGRLRRLVGVATDISQRKRAEAELRAAQTELVRTNQELEQRVQARTAELSEALEELEHFSYTITHDMRAPLRAMHSFAGTLQQEWRECPAAEREDLLRRIVEAAKRMDQLITDALNYSKAVKQERQLTEVETGSLLRGILETYPNLQPPQAEITLVEPLPKVLGNEAGLVQCFSNLLGNAVKFVPAGRVPRVTVWAEGVKTETELKEGLPAPRGLAREPKSEINSKSEENLKEIQNANAEEEASSESRRPSTLINSQPATGLVRLWFEDNGIGIAKQHQRVIWGMFERLDRTYEGTGIGLALVRKIVQRMGGRVGVESEVGKGSRFWVELRAAG